MVCGVLQTGLDFPQFGFMSAVKQCTLQKPFKRNVFVFISFKCKLHSMQVKSAKTIWRIPSFNTFASCVTTTAQLISELRRLLNSFWAYLSVVVWLAKAIALTVDSSGPACLAHKPFPQTDQASIKTWVIRETCNCMNWGVWTMNQAWFAICDNVLRNTSGWSKGPAGEDIKSPSLTSLSFCSLKAPIHSPLFLLLSFPPTRPWQ